MLFGSEDPVSTPEKREVMVKLYPSAELVLFEGGQHGIALTHREAYLSAINRFLHEE